MCDVVSFNEVTSAECLRVIAINAFVMCTRSVRELSAARLNVLANNSAPHTQFEGKNENKYL